MRGALNGKVVLIAAMAATVCEASSAPDQTQGIALMSAVVASDGVLFRGSGVTGSGRGFSATGDYVVTFNRSLANCTCVASVGFGALPVQTFDTAVATCPAANANSVEVITRDDVGSRDRPFQLIVFCPK